MNDNDDGIALHSISHPTPTGWARIYWTVRCWYSDLTWPIRRLWLTETVEIEIDESGNAPDILNNSWPRDKDAR